MADVRTVQLGQFTDAKAETVAAALQRAGIVWWHKSSGRYTRILSAGDWGTRLYVDATRLDEAQQLAREALSEQPDDL